MTKAKTQSAPAFGESVLLDWFARHGWQPFEFQRQAWSAFKNGESGLIHSATGTGKSYAALGGPLMDWINQHPDQAKWPATKPPGLTLLWITPLRALAADTEESLRLPVEELGISWEQDADTLGAIGSKRCCSLATHFCTCENPTQLQNLHK